eukprot:CAMPEP_0204651926 /NCGR_PEP_ID=MMETSP0718-20130828/14229_1 /ASSEMBLY_ACC=CAM_ASM_000674 /TAXON_ID=230516 /ORGANISM="Chaetoceros curvisetus" /LENGTH=110 /DNA_ID=CAMNT_0051675815 /DNA_START=40 /DNA_END=372 /DNA_ORIENTATION=-
MVWCPRSHFNLINHCSTRKQDGGDCAKYNNNESSDAHGPNAKLRWATGSWDQLTKDWLKLSLEGIEKEVDQRKRGPSLEVIATRKIHPGDEVFVDYVTHSRRTQDQSVPI